MTDRTTNGQISKWREYFHEGYEGRVEPADSMCGAIEAERARADAAVEEARHLKNNLDVTRMGRKNAEARITAVRDVLAHDGDPGDRWSREYRQLWRGVRKAIDGIEEQL